MTYYSCIRCNRELKNPAARQIGMGKICAAKSAADNDGAQQPSNFLDEEAGNPDIVLRRVDGNAKTNVPRRLISHSPTGFEWGYAGSGPADLALNILLHVGLAREEAENLHQSFKFKFVAAVPTTGGIIKRTDIDRWVSEQRAQAA
jgi:hypothetical protein